MSFITSSLWKTTGQLFGRMALNLGLSVASLRLNSGHIFFSQENHRSLLWRQMRLTHVSTGDGNRVAAGLSSSLKSSLCRDIETGKILLLTALLLIHFSLRDDPWLERCCHMVISYFLHFFMTGILLQKSLSSPVFLCVQSLPFFSCIFVLVYELLDNTIIIYFVTHISGRLDTLLILHVWTKQSSGSSSPLLSLFPLN
jgi:hypothetical protein